MKKILYFFFLFGVFFPFIDIFRLGLDTQPTSLIFGLLLLPFFGIKKIPKPVILLSIVFSSAVVLSFFYSITFNTLRDFSVYLSLLIIPLVTYKALQRFGKPSIRTLLIINSAYLFTGLVQVFHEPNFLNFLVSEESGAMLYGRGAASLTTESTYYGIVSSLLIIITLINYPLKKVKWILFLEFFQLVFLSRSATMLLVLIVAITIFIFIEILKGNLKLLSLSIVFLGFFAILIVQTQSVWEKTRAGNILVRTIKNPSLFVVLDASVNRRIMHTYIPIYSLYDNKLKPMGFSHFGNYSNKLYLEDVDAPLFSYYSLEQGKIGMKRIMCGYGPPFFHLGGIGLLVPFAIFSSFRRNLKHKKTLFAFIFFNLILFTAISFNMATVTFIIGNALYLNKRRSLFFKRRITN